MNLLQISRYKFCPCYIRLLSTEGAPKLEGSKTKTLNGIPLRLRSDGTPYRFDALENFRSNDYHKWMTKNYISNAGQPKTTLFMSSELRKVYAWFIQKEFHSGQKLMSITFFDRIFNGLLAAVTLYLVIAVAFNLYFYFTPPERNYFIYRPHHVTPLLGHMPEEGFVPGVGFGHGHGHDEHQ